MNASTSVQSHLYGLTVDLHDSLKVFRQYLLKINITGNFVLLKIAVIT